LSHFSHVHALYVCQVLFNVTFTAWKWAVTTVFGILPLAITLSVFAFILLIIPALRLGKAGYKDMVEMVKHWNKNRAVKKVNNPEQEPLNRRRRLYL